MFELKKTLNQELWKLNFVARKYNPNSVFIKYLFIYEKNINKINKMPNVN